MAAAQNALAVVRPLVAISRNPAEVDVGCSVVSTTVLNEAAWSVSTAYAIGDRVSYQDYVWEALIAHDGATPNEYNTSAWAQVGFTNQWRAFDRSTTARSAQAYTMFWRVRPGQACTHAAVIGMIGATSVRLIVANSLDFSIYDKTVTLSGINNYIADQVFSDLPNVAGCDLLFYLEGGLSLAVSEILFGAASKLGAGVHQGANLQFQDYSRKETDEFGEAILVPRAYAKRANFEMSVEREDIDTVMSTLASLRARPCLWIGHPSYQSTSIYGFFKDFSVDIAYATRAICTLSIEGMATQSPSDVFTGSTPAPSPGPSPGPSPAPGPTGTLTAGTDSLIAGPDTLIAGTASTTWSPAEFFLSGVEGGWYEASPAYLHVTTGGTNVTQAGDRVGRWLDISGNDRHMIQSSVNDRPTYQIAGGTPCVDLFNTLGVVTTTVTRIAGSGSFYGCVALEITTNYSAVIADTAGSGPIAGGVRVFFQNSTVYCVGYGNSGATYTCSVPCPSGRVVVQFWFDNVNKVLAVRVNDAAIGSVSTGTGGPVATAGLGDDQYRVALGMFPVTNEGAWNQKFFFAAYTVGFLPLQGARDSCLTYARNKAALVGSATPAPPPAVAPTIATLPHKDDWLLTGAATMASTSRGIFVHDNRWGRGGLVEGSLSTQFMQEVGRFAVTDGGPTAARFRWRWPQVANTEVKGYPSMLYGKMPGYESPDHRPAWEKFIKLPDGGTDSVDKNGVSSSQAGGGTISDLNLGGNGGTPGTVLPLQLPLSGGLVVDFDWKHNSVPTGQGQLVFDIWLTRASNQGYGFASSPISHEVMLPLSSWGNYGAHGVAGGRNATWYDHDQIIDGNDYYIYCTKGGDGQLLYNFPSSSALNGSYTNPETGGPATGWKMIAFVPKTMGQAGAGANQSGHCSINLAPLLNYMRTRSDVRPMPWMSGNEYVMSIEVGVEPIYGEGDVTLFNFQVTRT